MNGGRPQKKYIKQLLVSSVKVLTDTDYELYTFFATGEVETILKPLSHIAESRALEFLAVEIHNSAVSSQKFKTYAESSKMAKTLPANLEMSLKFTDTNSLVPNNIIDAGEESLILATITNNGKGTAFDVKLNIDTDYRSINFEKTIAVGDIQPNETKEIKVSLKAGLDIGDGKASFQFNLKEKRGYDAKKVAMYVPTARLEKPALEIVSTEINDGDTGLAKGNGNGIIESGETIELTAFIKNSGAGKAIGVNLNTADTISGIQWVRDSAFVGTISPGEIVKAKVAFSSAEEL